ncbi:MAG: tetraacyldisaccharide 4'-kinase [Candidatus Zixiibacteriota bacterium]
MLEFLTRAFVDWSAGDRRLALYCYGIFARPAGWIYRMVEWFARWRHRGGVLAGPHRAQLIVVSSPVAGGVGKTPLVAFIADRLQQQGRRVVIVTLGYGRTGRGTVGLGDARRTVDVAESGDEALELRQRTNIPVRVGDEPADIVAELDRDSRTDAVVFDDGVRRRWEHERRLAVLTSRDLEAPVRYLPDGRWRTTPRTVARAAAVAVTDAFDCSDSVREHHRRILAGWKFTGPVGWFATRVIALSPIVGMSAGSGTVPSGRPFVFCGLGQPRRFLAQVRSAGFEPGGFHFYTDHHRYRRADAEQLDRRRSNRQCTWFLTTHKDAVKIDPAWLGSTPAYFLRISLQQVAGDDLFTTLAGNL